MNHVAALGRAGDKSPVILGAPHSGASILGKAMARLGRSALVCNEAITSAQAEPAGAESVATLNERIVQDLCIRWDMPLLFWYKDKIGFHRPIVWVK